MTVKDIFNEKLNIGDKVEYIKNNIPCTAKVEGFKKRFGKTLVDLGSWGCVHPDKIIKDRRNYISILETELSKHLSEEEFLKIKNQS